MGRVCCVLGCPSGGDAPSHQIPKNPVLFQKWKDMIYSEKIQHMTDEQISKCTVCYRHFASDDYLITYRVRKLKRGIAPSLNLPNKPASSSSEPDVVKTEPDTESEPLSASASVKEERVEGAGSGEAAAGIALFEDAPETLELRFEESPDRVSSNERVERIDLATEPEFESHCKKERASRRKRARLKQKQLTLLRCKKQAERYERTPTIQRILSLLTSDEVAAAKAKIRRSRYLPKVYVKVYHDIAKSKALSHKT
ncbi:hypothetical protein DMN91_011874 [Ooceraea biroi]|uniref:THAP-type domain-containing protein n=1 Tax=Ooceraea biroi TaxID=2015173 RepID=A0A026WIQ0_OOCBI|nr:uncharacterized protein LOC105278880 [Ooceraea biroi]EZA55853.1 hypothetical protein X777_04028 [Ooceraea biroi]RLU16115.1 hypothetical protein DMN91_011874 [Ooceraea biroi]